MQKENEEKILYLMEQLEAKNSKQKKRFLRYSINYNKII